MGFATPSCSANRALARHLASELADPIEFKDDPGRYGTAGFDQLAEQIPQPHEPWAETFFGELERIAVELHGEQGRRGGTTNGCVVAVTGIPR